MFLKLLQKTHFTFTQTSPSLLCFLNNFLNASKLFATTALVNFSLFNASDSTDQHRFIST